MSAPIDYTELFARAENALGFLGLTAAGEWGDTLRTLLTYKADPSGLDTFGEWLTWVDEQVLQRIERRQLENERQAAISKHVGTRGERQSFTVRITKVLHFPAKEDTDEPWGEKWLTLMADDEGNVLTYWNTIKVPAPTPEDPKLKRPATDGERVTFDAMVYHHNDYKGVNQTVLQRATKGKLAA